MSRGVVGGLVVGLLAMIPMRIEAAEHGGKEHAGQEHGGASAAQPQMAPTPAQATPPAAAEPSAQRIRQTIRTHISGIQRKQGAFTIDDEVTKTTRTLTLVRVHERVGKTGQLYYACTDMRDAKTGELLDLDFDVEAAGGTLNVVDVRIHKLNGKPRYTYDKDDNRIPLM